MLPYAEDSVSACMTGNALRGALGHVPQLDGIRALAIVIVMVSHTALGNVVPGGFGVTLFFFLSGFLITTLLRREAATTGRVDLPAFYLRRTVRILPPMILTILFTTALAYAGLLAAKPHWYEVAADLAFLTNYAPLFGVTSTAPTPLWSLDVEEHFYILFSTLFAAIFVWIEPRRAAFVCGALCVSVLLIRVAHWQAGTPLTDIYYWSHTRIDSILFGCILALWHNPQLDRAAWRPPLWAVGAALVAVLSTFVIRDEVFRQTLRYSIQGIALFVLFSASLHDRGPLKAILGSAPLRFIALLSYTLYLVHLPLLMAVGTLGLPLAPVVAYVLAFAYALAMYRWVERPLGRWRRRVERRRNEYSQIAYGEVRQEKPAVEFPSVEREGA